MSKKCLTQTLKDIKYIDIQFYTEQDWDNEDRSTITNIDVYSESQGLLSPDKVKIGKYTLHVKQKVLEDALYDVARGCRKYEVELTKIPHPEDTDDTDADAHMAYMASGCESFDEFIDRYNEGEF
jgi:hypothetical protein